MSGKSKKKTKLKSYKTGDIVYRCNICSITTNNKNDLMKHFEEKHSSKFIMAYMCPFCDVALEDKESQKKHALKCIKDNDISSSNSRSVDQEMLLLQMLNAVLTILGKSEINKITDFKKIRRNDLDTKQIAAIADELEDKFYDVGFSRYDCGYYRKEDVSIYIVSLIRGVCKRLGFKLISQKKDIKKGNKRTSESYYSIIRV